MVSFSKPLFENLPLPSAPKTIDEFHDETYLRTLHRYKKRCPGDDHVHAIPAHPCSACGDRRSKGTRENIEAHIGHQVRCCWEPGVTIVDGLYYCRKHSLATQPLIDKENFENWMQSLVRQSNDGEAKLAAVRAAHKEKEIMNIVRDKKQEIMDEAQKQRQRAADQFAAAMKGAFVPEGKQEIGKSSTTSPSVEEALRAQQRMFEEERRRMEADRKELMEMIKNLQASMAASSPASVNVPPVVPVSDPVRPPLPSVPSPGMKRTAEAPPQPAQKTVRMKPSEFVLSPKQAEMERKVQIFKSDLAEKEVPERTAEFLEDTLRKILNRNPQLTQEQIAEYKNLVKILDLKDWRLMKEKDRLVPWLFSYESRRKSRTSAEITDSELSEIEIGSDDGFGNLAPLFEDVSMDREPMEAIAL